jgi:hypothetical protein
MKPYVSIPSQVTGAPGIMESSVPIKPIMKSSEATTRAITPIIFYLQKIFFNVNIIEYLPAADRLSALIYFSVFNQGGFYS